MNIIILILMALGFISGPDQFTEEYRRNHSDQVDKAIIIYNNHQYVEMDGGVVIDDDANPLQ